MGKREAGLSGQRGASVSDAGSGAGTRKGSFCKAAVPLQKHFETSKRRPLLCRARQTEPSGSSARAVRGNGRLPSELENPSNGARGSGGSGKQTNPISTYARESRSQGPAPRGACGKTARRWAVTPARNDGSKREPQEDACPFIPAALAWHGLSRGAPARRALPELYPLPAGEVTPKFK